MPQQESQDDHIYEKHDVDIRCQELSGHAEYRIHIPDSTLEDAPASLTPEDVAENLVESYVEAELGSETNLRATCRAKQITDFQELTKSLRNDDVTEFSVWVRYS